MRLPEGVDRIEVWLDIVRQLSFFFEGASSFSARVAKAIRADPSFRKCHWTAEDIDTLLHPIEVHVEAATSVRNRCEEALTLISREWGVEAEGYIRSQGLLERSLKLIASVAKRRDVPDLKTGLLLANTHAVKRIMEGKTFHSRRLFLTPQDWQICKDNPVPSRDIFDEELHDAGVHLNLAGEICPGRLLLPLPAPTTTTPTTTTAPITSTPAPSSSTPAPTTTTAASIPPAPIPTTSAPTPTSPAPSSKEGQPDNSATSSTKADESALRAKVASVAEEDDEESDFELPSRGQLAGVLGASAVESVVGPNVVASLGVEGLSGAELKKKQLDEWLHCRGCSGLNVLWCEDVLNKLCDDLVGCLGVLGGYFYTHVHVCKTHRPLLAACCHLKTEGAIDIHDRLQTMWSNGLSHGELMAFAKDHQDWFISSSSVASGA